MPIRAIFAPGQTEITVNGLHQWDYGQKLEIHSADLPIITEVHFACVGMREAIVRACDFTAGKAEVTIPDRCLEQTTPVTAWVFVIDGTAGTTTKRITLPIEARPRPSVGEDIPEEVTNRYTELITSVNNAVAKLTAGEIKAMNAFNADEAGHASDADYAEEADHADAADYANDADHAKEADYASVAESANTAGRANTATLADHATTTDLLAQGYTAPTDAEMKNFTPKNRVYVFVFTAEDGYSLTTTVLMPVPHYYDNQRSAESARGEYIVYNPSAANKLTFYNMSNVSYSPSQIWYREL